jgi:hypothetical protein
MSYAPMFYPGTHESSAATVVTVGIAQQLTGIDIGLSRVATSRIVGVVANAARLRNAIAC